MTAPTPKHRWSYRKGTEIWCDSTFTMLCIMRFVQMLPRNRKEEG